jgi:hypothetical protein
MTASIEASCEYQLLETKSPRIGAGTGQNNDVLVTLTRSPNPTPIGESCYGAGGFDAGSASRELTSLNE